MLYRELAGIANQISQIHSDIDGLLEMFCMRKVANRKFLAAVYLEVGKDGRLHLRGFYGAMPGELGISEEPISIFDKHPASDAVRNGSIAWTNLQKQNISKPVNIPGFLIAWPIFAEQRIIGALLALSDSPIKDNVEDLEYFEALASIIGNAILNSPASDKSIENSRMSKINDDLSRNPSEDHKSLSERQELILKLISEGRTNGDIADILGYSESLIRQETIRIYAILGCSGRAEAAAWYRNQIAAPELVPAAKK